MKDPAFLMYSKDWLSGTAEMSHTEKGVYIDLLCYQHQNDGIPSQVEKIARIAGMTLAEFEPVWNELKSKFIPGENDRLFNGKLTNEIKRRGAFSRTKTVFGIFGAFVKKLDVKKAVIDQIKESFDYKQFKETPEANLKAEVEAQLKLLLKQYGTVTGAVTGTASGAVTETLLGKEGAGEKPFLQKSKTDKPENPFSEDFLSGPWQQWKEYKQGIKKPVKPESENIALKKLHKLSGGDEARACEIIEESIAQGWVGLYLPKESQQQATNHKPESPTQTDDITRIIDEFNALTQSQYDKADEAIRGYLAGRLMDGCQLQDMLDVIALKAVQWGTGEHRKWLKFHTLFKPEKYPGYVQEVRDAKAGKIKVINPNESAYDRIQRKIDAALGRTQSA